MNIQRAIVAAIAMGMASLLAEFATANVIINPSFEAGAGEVAAWWTNVAGPFGSTGRSGSMPNTDNFSGYLQADHIGNPGAPTPYSLEQLQPAGTIDNTLNYNFSFSAKVDSNDFTGFDMGYQILWLDGVGAVQGETFNSLISAGINTSYQTFGLNDLDVPDGANSFHLRFQLLPGAVADVANGLYIDDVVLEPIGGQPVAPVDPNNLLLNPGFETGDGEVAAWWSATINGGEFGSVSRSNSMPNSDDFGAYLQADHFGNSGAATPYGIEQFLPPGTIDDALNYDLSFSAKVDSTDFTGFDMTYQIVWLDEFGAVQGNEFHSLLSEGIDTSYQTFGLSDLEVPESANSLLLRFELLPGADPDIANGLYIDDVVIKVASTSSQPGDFNGDGAVDGADFLEWQRDPGVGSLSVWQANYPASAAVSAAVNVPEPTTAFLALMGVMLSTGRHFRAAGARTFSDAR